MTDKAYKTTFEHLVDMEGHLGQEIGLTEWFQVDQERINTFATVTEDEQWIHVDPERSAAHSPYKTTIAHGFLVLSFAAKVSYEVSEVKDVVMGVNYGLNKVRFPNATKVGSWLRGRVKLIEYNTIPGGAQYVMECTFELKGEEKPACVAQMVARAYTK